MYHTDDTIAAIASAAGGAARGIVRISGNAALGVLRSCFRPDGDLSLDAMKAATVLTGTVKLVGSRVAELPADVYLWPTAQSYTRQAIVEIHTIGSPPLITAVLASVCRAGARLAEPGEFTLRAFLAGRLDLTQAEAVLGIIDARGSQQFRDALGQLAGGLSKPLRELRDALVNLLADVEAGLDFVEEDIQFVNPRDVATQLDLAAGLVNQLKSQLAGRSYQGDTARAVLVGWPNVGKSSLFNALSGCAAALVSSQPGTTRDYLAATLELGSVLCELIDTAGVEPCTQPGGIAAMAQQLATRQHSNCDIRILCLDSRRGINDWEREQLAAPPGCEQFIVWTKCDEHAGLRPGAIATSARTGRGLDRLRRVLAEAVLRLERGDTAASLAAQRSADSLGAADDSLARARLLNQITGQEELLAAELRIALLELGKVAGTVYTDDILDRIFSRFCIGK